MKVVGARSKHVGFAKRLDGGQVVVGRPNGKDIRVPASAWRLASNNQIVLNVPADEVDDKRWTMPVQGRASDG